MALSLGQIRWPSDKANHACENMPIACIQGVKNIFDKSNSVLDIKVFGWTYTTYLHSAADCPHTFYAQGVFVIRSYPVYKKN